MKQRHFSIVLLVALLGACSTTPILPPAAKPSEVAPPPAAPSAAQSETAPQPARPKTKTSATFALLSAADEALAVGESRQAILLMERAVRIEPRNFELWIRLSRAHLASGNLASATQHARKAIALADVATGELGRASKAKAWLQYANVLDARGDTREAASIRDRYRPQRG